MDKIEYLTNLLIQNEVELIGRKITHVYNFEGIILFLDNGKMMLTTVTDDGWNKCTTIENDATILLGNIKYSINFRNTIEKYSNFNVSEFNNLN